MEFSPFSLYPVIRGTCICKNTTNKLQTLDFVYALFESNSISLRCLIFYSEKAEGENPQFLIS